MSADIPDTAPDIDPICRLCGTDLREGSHGVIKASDGHHITFGCRFPRDSALPRRVRYLVDTSRRARASQSPREAQDAHIQEFGDKR